MNADPDVFFDLSAPARLIRLAEVKRRTGMSTSTIYRWMSKGKFPRSHAIGDRIAVWSEADVEAWIRTALEGNSLGR
jgi:prophage regulatory protein